MVLDDHKLRLGLPEILLGIFPGWGGSMRLPALIGAPKAMSLILAGRTVSAKDAYKMGIVDDRVPQRHLKDAAVKFILEQPKSKHPTQLESLTNTALARPFLANQMRNKVSSKVKEEHYPAGFELIKIWQQHGVDREHSQIAAANALAKLVVNETARNLVRVFYLREGLKGLAKENKFKASHVHVIGAGTMGGDIAAWCAYKGIHVTLEDREPKYVAPAIKRAHELFVNKLKEPRLVQAAMDRLVPDVAGEGVKVADIVIEAIFENLEAKHELLKRVEPQLKPNAFIATNTSSFPLDELNTVMKHPDRLVGIHFFNPVAKMDVVEVVHGKITNDKVNKNAISFVGQLGKLPLPVTSQPGFLVNRILLPYLSESVRLLTEGVPGPVIDKAATDFGMPMGPIELADTVGLDICLSVAENLAKHYEITIHPRLRELVKEGHLGRKTGQGFYKYRNGKAEKTMPRNYNPPADLTDRLILRILNESMGTLREEVVANGDRLDAGMIFGTGFAPFRGGPMQYISQTGAAKLQQTLLQLQQRHGDRFKPDAAWNKGN